MAPVLFLIFNRPETTLQVLERIRTHQPARLYIAADGPREHKPGEREACARVREEVLKAIDWDCEVKTLFRDVNMGCKRAVSSAITWFFENEESGIILEDDCLPHLDFFRFCNQLLEAYRDDERVMHISGNNFQFGKKWGDESYYYSAYTHIWGWATWRRAWRNYDVAMTDFPEYRRRNMVEGTWGGEKRIADYWMKKFEAVHDNQIDTWDYQWTYAVWKNSGLCIIPQENLVKNIGFDDSFTHKNHFARQLTVDAAGLQALIHPQSMVRNWKADCDYAYAFHVRGYKKGLNLIINKLGSRQ